MVTMKQKNFNKLIENYDSLNYTDVNKFFEITNKFPYFQVANFFYVKALKDQKKDEYNNLITKLALITSNRSVLANAIQKKYKFKKLDQIKSSSKKTNKLKKELKRIGDQINSKLILKSEYRDINMTFTDWIEFTKNKEISKNNLSSKKNPLHEKMLTIDKFIKDKPKISKVLDDKKTSSEIIDQYYPDELMTETLAKVLLRQKKYKKAISAYKILSLKYPEKNVFFAGQIEKIKNLQQE